MKLRDKLAACEARLAETTRDLHAAREWIRHESAPTSIVRVVGGMHVLARGLTRTCGGVVLARYDDNDFAGTPEFLDDLCARWQRDGAEECRDAARKLLALRDDACRTKGAT